MTGLGVDIKHLKVYLFYGKKGACKSMYMASLSERLFKSYVKQEKKYPDLKQRYLYSNMKFAKEFEIKHEKNLKYWTHPEQLYSIRNADILWDEIGKDLPAGSWINTPKELRQVFSHLRKRGNRIFANTQVYEDVDIAVRRQTDHAYEIKKLFGSRDISASLPPPNLIYGLAFLREFDPMQIEYYRDPEDREELVKSWFPIPLLITRRLVTVYDTTAELPPYQPDKLKEIRMVCREGENCMKKDKHGNPHTVVTHEPV